MSVCHCAWPSNLKPEATALALLLCRRMPSLNRSHVTLTCGLPYDLTPTHYGIGSETPNLKPTGFKSKRLDLGSANVAGVGIIKIP